MKTKKSLFQKNGIISRHFMNELKFSFLMKKKSLNLWLKKVGWINGFYIISYILFVFSLLLNSKWVFLAFIILLTLSFILSWTNKKQEEKRDFSFLENCSVKERINYARKKHNDIEVLCFIVGMPDIPINEASSIASISNNEEVIKVVLKRMESKKISVFIH